MREHDLLRMNSLALSRCFAMVACILLTFTATVMVVVFRWKEHDCSDSDLECQKKGIVLAQRPMMSTNGVDSATKDQVIVKPVHFKSEVAACEEPLPDIDKTSEEDEEPKVGVASPGLRVRMPAYQGMEYQLFLPAKWENSSRYPVVVFLHGHGDGKFSVMNSQSLPRLLARDQSTVFDTRTCWCLDSTFVHATAMRESGAHSKLPFLDEKEDLNSPMADCDFADTFSAVVIMPQDYKTCL